MANARAEGFSAFDRNDLTWAIQSQSRVEADACKEQMNSDCNMRKVSEQLILSILKRELLVETSTAQDGMKMWLQATNRIIICTSQPSLKGRGNGVFNCYNSVRSHPCRPHWAARNAVLKCVMPLPLSRSFPWQPDFFST